MKELTSGIFTVNVPPTSAEGGVELVVKAREFVFQDGLVVSSCLLWVDSDMYALHCVPEEAEAGRLVLISRLGDVYFIVVFALSRGGVVLSLLITVLMKNSLVIVPVVCVKISA